MPRFLSTTLTLLLGVVSVVAVNAVPRNVESQQVNPLAEEYLELDANGDGKITEAEVLKDRSQKFKKLDADGDGTITLEEVRLTFNTALSDEVAGGLRERGIDDLSILFFESLDANDDDRVDLVEFQRPARERFLQIDANSDGFATPGETTVFFSRIRF
jgi:hypothetical protein